MLNLKIPKEKKKLETSNKPQYIPKKTLGLDVVDPDHWIKLYAIYKDLFEEPSTLVEWDIKHQIDVLNLDMPVKNHE